MAENPGIHEQHSALTTAEAVKALSTAPPTTFKGISEAITSNPVLAGQEIKGLGSLPEVRPLETPPNRWFRRLEGSPDPDVVDEGLRHKLLYDRESFETTSIDFLGALLLREQNTLGITDDEITQLLEFHTHNLIQSGLEQYKAFPKEQEAYEHATIESVKNAYEDKVQETNSYWNERKMEIEQDLPSDPEDWKMRNIRKRYASEKDFTLVDRPKDEQLALLIQKQTEDLTEEKRQMEKAIRDVPDNYGFEKIGKIINFKKTQETTSLGKYEANRRENGRRVMAEAVNTLTSGSFHITVDLIRHGDDDTTLNKEKLTANVLSNFDKIKATPYYPKPKALHTDFNDTLKQTLLKAIETCDESDDKRGRSFIIHSTQKYLHEGGIPDHVFKKELEAFFPTYHARDAVSIKLLNIYKDILEKNTFRTKGSAPFEDFLQFQKFAGLLTHDPDDIIKALKYVKDHSREYRGDEERKTFIKMGPIYERPPHLGDGYYNTSLIYPCFPSKEALNEIIERNESALPINLPKELIKYWNVAQVILTEEGYDPEKWRQWAYATKQPFLMRHADDERKRELSYLLHADKGHQIDSSEDSHHDDVKRFPTETEIRQTFHDINHVESPRRKHFAHNAKRFTLVPMRIDRELGTNKYAFTPVQWAIAYEDIYDAMRRDFFRDNSPDSWICALRKAVLQIMTGNHGEFVKSGNYVALAPDFDEFDTLMFLPAIAHQNGNDPGFFLLGQRLIFQMDPRDRILYAKEIAQCMHYLRAPRDNWKVDVPETQLISKKEIEELTQSQYIRKTNMIFGASNEPQHQDRWIAQSVEMYKGQPNPDAVFNTTPFVLVLEHDNHWGQILSNEVNSGDVQFVTKDEFDAASTYAKNNLTETDPEKRRWQYRNLLDNKLIELHLGENTGGHRWMTNHHHTDIFENPSLIPDDAHTKPWDADEEPWADPDIVIDQKTGELKPALMPEIVTPGMASSMERLQQTLPELAKTVETIGEREENTNLGPLFSASSLISILTGRKEMPTDVAQVTTTIDQVNQIAARLRGSTPAEVRELLATLDTPLTHKELSPEGKIGIVWQTAGYLEREAVARDIIQGVAGAFRISVRRILMALENHKAQNLTQELIACGIPEDEAHTTALESIAFTMYGLREKLQEQMNLGAAEKQKRPRVMLQKPKPVLLTTSPLRDQFEDKERYFQTMLKHMTQKRPVDPLHATLTTSMALCMKDLSQSSDYNFASTTWLQLMDQLFAEEGKSFLSSEGRLQMYCVQSSYLLHELLTDMTGPLESQKWHKPIRISIALEDELYGMTIEDYYKNQRKMGFGETTPDSFNHYFVFVELPQKTPHTKAQFLVLDQTENTIRLFSEDAVQTRTGRELVINNEKSHWTDTEGKKLDETKTQTRLVYAPEIADQSLNMIGAIMEEAGPLKHYAYVLDETNPRTFLDKALDPEFDIYEKATALRHLIHSAPYFIGESGFYTGGRYKQLLTELIDLTREIDDPVIGLFVSRTLAIQEETDEILGLFAEETPANMREPVTAPIEQCIDKIALFSDAQWELEKSHYARILLPADILDIEEKREAYKKLSEKERIEIEEKADETIQIHTNMNIPLFEEIDRQEQTIKQEQRSETVALPGSPERMVGAKVKITMHAEAQEERHQIKIPALPPTTTGPTPQSSVTVHQPVALSPIAQKQAARSLLKGLHPEEIEKALREYTGLFRAFLVDAKPKDTAFHASAWEKANEALRTVLLEKGLPSPEQPLAALLEGGGSLETLKTMSREEVLSMITAGHMETPRQLMEHMAEEEASTDPTIIDI